MAKNKKNPSAKDTFRRKMMYDLVSPRNLKTQPVDFWQNKYGMYGRIDFDGNPVFLREDSALAEITSPGNNSVNYALPFVAEAFIDFRRFYHLAIQRNVITSNTKIKMSVEKSWQSFNQAYNDHHDSFYTVVAENWLTPSKTSDIITFKDFCIFMFKEIEKMERVKPITRTGFLMSNQSSVLNTGLVIEISNKDYNDDPTKFRDFMQDPNYKFYVESAKKFGFFVDKNIPWRLVADIRSKPMKEYMDFTSGTNADKMFRDYYFYSFNHDLTSLRDYLQVYYRDFVSLNPTISKLNGSCIEVINRVTEPERVEPEFWLRGYTLLRAIEANKDWSQAQFDGLVSRVVQVYQSSGISKAVRKINKSFNNAEDGTERPARNNLTYTVIADIVEPYKRRGSFRF